MEPEPVALAVQGLTLHLSRCCFARCVRPEKKQARSAVHVRPVGSQGPSRNGVSPDVKPVYNRSKTSRKTARQVCKTTKTGVILKKVLIVFN